LVCKQEYKELKEKLILLPVCWSSAVFPSW